MQKQLIWSKQGAVQEVCFLSQYLPNLRLENTVRKIKELILIKDIYYRSLEFKSGTTSFLGLSGNLIQLEVYKIYPEGQNVV